jgi:formylglycine-generating enzyme required for sulfatase activity
VPSEAAGALKELLPPDFDQWFARCVHIDASKRYQDILQAFDDLNKLVNAMPSPPAIVPQVETKLNILTMGPSGAKELPVGKHTRKLVVGGVVVIGMVGLVWGVYSSSRLQEAPPLASAVEPPKKPVEAKPVEPSKPTAKELELGLKPPADKPVEEPRPGTGGMVRLEGGTFRMGSEEGDWYEKPVHWVTLKPFWLDVTEVTVAAYKACVDAGACSKPDEGNWCNWGKSDRGNHPINCVDWEQATQFCRWANKRLPTEEEWEYGTRQGGVRGDRKYPWGNAEPSNQLCWDGKGKDAGENRRRGTCPVGSYPLGDTPTGLKDMAGNVWEWTASASCPYTNDGYNVSKRETARVTQEAALVRKYRKRHLAGKVGRRKTPPLLSPGAARGLDRRNPPSRRGSEVLSTLRVVSARGRKPRSGGASSPLRRPVPTVPSTVPPPPGGPLVRSEALRGASRGPEG